ncbi:Na+/H+ antiporter subunit E [Testudinibacter sp. P80/BLE/0925]|uniref:Na+/H+ antiporter subunit E n=1 Tax=Testudinibacter sp. TW-1 TaxID=3417757 RepID=UPI003D365C35
MKKSYVAVLLGLQFLYLMVKSGFTTLCLILKLQLGIKQSLRDSYIAIQIPQIGETGLVVLSCLVCLTPGTTVLDINNEDNRMLLHILDAEQTDLAIQEIQTKFVPYISTLFAKSATT